MRQSSGLFELKFRTELEKQEFIERSLVQLIESTKGSVRWLRCQNILEKGMLAAFVYFGYPLLKEQTPASSAAQAEQVLSSWGKILLTCSFVGCLHFNIRTGEQIKAQEKIHADSLRDLPQVRGLIAKLKAQPSSTQNNQEIPNTSFNL